MVLFYEKRFADLDFSKLALDRYNYYMKYGIMFMLIWITYTHVTVLLTDLKLDCIRVWTFAEFIVWDGLEIGKLDNRWCKVDPSKDIKHLIGLVIDWLLTHLQSALDISKLWGLFFTSSNYQKCKSQTRISRIQRNSKRLYESIIHFDCFIQP